MVEQAAPAPGRPPAAEVPGNLRVAQGWEHLLRRREAAATPVPRAALAGSGAGPGAPADRAGPRWDRVEAAHREAAPELRAAQPVPMPARRDEADPAPAAGDRRLAMPAPLRPPAMRQAAAAANVPHRLRPRPVK